MCAGCHQPLPATGTRFMLTVRTETGGDDVAFCTADCRRRWAEACRTPRAPRTQAA